MTVKSVLGKTVQIFKGIFIWNHLKNWMQLLLLLYSTDSLLFRLFRIWLILRYLLLRSPPSIFIYLLLCSIGIAKDSITVYQNWWKQGRGLLQMPAVPNTGLQKKWRKLDHYGFVSQNFLSIIFKRLHFHVDY